MKLVFPKSVMITVNKKAVSANFTQNPIPKTGPRCSMY